MLDAECKRICASFLNDCKLAAFFEVDDEDEDEDEAVGDDDDDDDADATAEDDVDDDDNELDAAKCLGV